MAVWFRPRDMNHLKISALTFDEFHDSGIEPARLVLVPEYYLHGPHLEATAQQRARRQGTANSLAPAHSASGSRFSTQLRRERHGIHRIDKNAEHQRPWRLYCLHAPSASSSSLVPSETPPIMAKVRRQEVLGDMRVFGLEFLRPLE